MNDAQIAQWKRERDIAREIKDPEERRKALEKVYDHRDEMQMQCIAHQAERIKVGLANDAILDRNIKSVAADLAKLKEEVKPLKETDKEFRENKLRLQGAKILWKLLKYVAAMGGGAAIMRALNFGG